MARSMVHLPLLPSMRHPLALCGALAFLAGYCGVLRAAPTSSTPEPAPSTASAPIRIEDDESPKAKFAEVRQAFDKGSYKQAQYLGETLDKELRKQNKVSPALFELMGHISYREGALGQATLWYQRAALFPPPVPEVRQNLQHIHNRTGNLELPSQGARSQLAAWFSRQQWLQLSVLSAWVVVLSLAACVFLTRSATLRACLLTLGVLSALAGGLGLLGWLSHPSFDSIKDIAVVTGPEIHAYTAASSTSGEVIKLPPGSEVRQLESRGAWTYVQIPSDDGGDDHRGWVTTTSLSPLWPDEYSPRFLE